MQISRSPAPLWTQGHARRRFTPVATESGDRSPAAVFIVEDQPIMRETYRLIFRYMPFLRVCGVAASGEEALSAFPGASPDLVLVDLSLPGMSGIELVRAITRDYPQVRVLVTSGYSDAEHERESREAGAHAFVPKGDMPALEAEIKRLIA